MTRTRTIALAAALTVAAAGSPALASPAAQRESTAVCRILVAASSAGLPARASGLDRLAQLSLRLEGGVLPSLNRLARRPAGVPETDAGRETIALLRAWRDSARSEVTVAHAAPSADAEAVRRDLEARVALSLASRGRDCPFPGFAAPSSGARPRLALAFEAVRLSVERPPSVWRTRRAAYGKAVARAATRGVTGPTLRRARRLAVVLDASRAAFLARDASGQTEARARLGAEGALLLGALLGRGPADPYAGRPSARVPAGWVRVPALAGGPSTAYDSARAARLRLAVPSGWTEGDLIGTPRVMRQSPRAGTPVPPGAPVAVTLGAAAVGSPVTISPAPVATVPDFSAFTLTGVRQWSSTTTIYLEVDYAPLPWTAGAATLDANYRVGGQSPAAGQRVEQYTPVAGGGIRVNPVRITASLAG